MRTKHLPRHLFDRVAIGRKAHSHVSDQSVAATADQVEQLLSARGEPPPLLATPWRIVTIGILSVGMVFVLVARAASLQLIHGEEYRTRSEGNRIVLRAINAARGIIFDAYHAPLTRNVPGFRQQVSSPKGQAPESGTGHAFRILSYEDALRESLSASQERIQVDALRSYAVSSLAHTIGYVSEITEEEQKGGSSYNPGDRIGRTGIEAQYERILRGKPGRELVEVNAQGNEIRVLKSVPAQAGQDVTTTIDAKLQDVLATSMADTILKTHTKAGAAIALDPKTNSVLATVSFPQFDPNLFTLRTDTPTVLQVLTDPSFPLLNRAIGAAYPPGSAFKLVTALAGLSAGSVTKDTIIQDTGEIFLGPYRFPNWYYVQYGRTEGELTLTRALARSNDIYFYKTAEWVGIEQLATVARMLGIGRLTGIDVPGEVAGLMPDESWKMRVKKEPWFPGNTYHVGIGQGDVLATPLQVAVITAYIANGGKLIPPRVVSPGGNASSPLPKVFKDEHIALLKQGMKQACQLGGTGWPLFDFAVPTGCKTGTAEFGKTPHAWFTVFAPYDDPKIVVTILIEEGGEGASVAAPVARKVLEWWTANRM